MILYDFWRSSASYRVRIALGLAGLGWESVPADLTTGRHRTGDHLSRNPQGLVPVLDMEGHLFTQSLSIIEYLNETLGMQLLPEDPLARASVRSLAYAIAMEIHPVCNVSVARFAAENSRGGITMESWMKRFIGPGLAAVESMSDDGNHCFGDRISLADICLVPQMYNARRWGIDLEPMPKLRRISAHLESLPDFAAAHPDLAPR